MATISYTLKVPPYEAPNLSGSGTHIRDTKNVNIDFQFNHLSEERKALWMDLERPFNTQYIKLKRYDIALREPSEGDLFGRAAVITHDWVSEQELSLDDAFRFLAEQHELRAELEAQAEEAKTRFKDITESMQRERDARRKAEAEARAEAERQRLAEAARIEFGGGKAIVDLFAKVRDVAEVTMDSRFSGNWIKRLDAVDVSKSNGYAFEGVFIREGLVELDQENAVFLVAGTSGSRKHSSTEYRIVTLTCKGGVGHLERTEITADSRERGWALQIRDQTTALLAEVTGAEATGAGQTSEFAALHEAVASDEQQVTVDRDLLARLLEFADA